MAFLSRALTTVLALAVFLAAGIVVYRRMTATPPPLGQVTPEQRVALNPKHDLRNPFANNIQSVAAEGHELFIKSQCIGCHGLDGDGHVCPSLRNGVWTYGSSDDALFRLIASGSGGMLAQGYPRVHPETVGAMPPMGTVIKTDADVWKIISWIRSIQPAAATPQPPPAQKLPQATP